MRRLTALAALGAALCLAGCSGEAAAPTPGAAAPTAPVVGGESAAPRVKPNPVDPSVAASADAALSGDTQAICDQAARTSTDFGKTFVADLQLKIDAAADGGEVAKRANEKIARDVQNYSYALADMARLTSDATLKASLTSMSKEVTALKGDVAKLNAEKMSALTAKLDKACGKA